MRNRSIHLAILAVALSLGTAWAVRGKFGHEQGAAWAGAIGALCLILAARRADWYEKAFRILMAASFGWGISGVMSYGVIVGYGRGVDFLNVFYGFLMLFVVGVLYGFLGGGFFALALIDSEKTKVKWASLLAEMVAFALLSYGLLINQLQWLMTPPRSEMWAACLGAAFALAWYMLRHQHKAAMKVAAWSAVGAGFGFAFGNFLQVMGNVSGADFNFWNVMEYSIGFFGGAGMAYGTLTSSWASSGHETTVKPELIPLLFVVLLVPFVVWQQSFVTDRFDFVLQNGFSASVVFFMKLIAMVAILLVAMTAIVSDYTSFGKNVLQDRARFLKRFFVLFMMLYIFLSFLVTGVLIHPLEQYLYIVNLTVILVLLSRVANPFRISPEKPQAWLAVAMISILAIALFTVIAINSHEEIRGSHRRFENRRP